jgi:hypothetical protein
MWKPLKMLPASTESCSLGVEFTDASLKSCGKRSGQRRRGRGLRRDREMPFNAGVF